MIRKLLIITSLFLTLLGCSSEYKSTEQVEQYAYIQLKGNYQDSEIILNNGESLSANSLSTFKDGNEVVISIPVDAGTHDLKVKKNGQLKVHRKLFVSEGESREVLVP